LKIFRSAFEDADIEESASAVTQILTPVCITMGLVVCIVRGMNLYSGGMFLQPSLRYFGTLFEVPSFSEEKNTNSSI
jgi:hypothetical protein